MCCFLKFNFQDSAASKHLFFGFCIFGGGQGKIKWLGKIYPYQGHIKSLVLPNVLHHSIPSSEISLSSFSFSSHCLSAPVVLAFWITAGHRMGNEYTALEMNFKYWVFQKIWNLARCLFPFLLFILYNFWETFLLADFSDSDKLDPH